MRCRAFTLIELLLVLFLVAILASLVAPVVTGSIGRAKESALREDLYLLRKGIDDYHADHGAYPAEIDKLVEKRYLRKIPVDPITGKQDTWIFVREDGTLGNNKGNTIIDVHSGSEDRASDGSAYKEW
jgi:general secretion pathway protein G